MLEISLALVAAFLFALGTVLQQKGTLQEPKSEALEAGLLLRLLRRPVWLLGIVVDALGYVAQAAALGIGRLVIVQPLLVTTVVFALPLGRRLTAQRVGRREWLGALAVTVGLAVFLLVSNPTGGKDDAPFGDWLVAGGICFGVAAALVVAGLRRRAGVKAALFGTAAGVLFGLTAALTKATVDRFDDGFVAVVADWHLYALAVVSVVGLYLSQVSLQTGALAPAIATTMAFDPIASLLLGMLLLDEQLHESSTGVAGALAALAVTLVGLVALASAKQADDVVEAPAGAAVEPAGP